MLYKDKAQNVLFAFLFLHLQLLSQVKAPAAAAAVVVWALMLEILVKCNISFNRNRRVFLQKSTYIFTRGLGVSIGTRVWHSEEWGGRVISGYMLNKISEVSILYNCRRILTTIWYVGNHIMISFHMQSVK